jgi:hypothetical protein
VFRRFKTHTFHNPLIPMLKLNNLQELIMDKLMSVKYNEHQDVKHICFAMLRQCGAKPNSEITSKSIFSQTDGGP